MNEVERLIARYNATQAELDVLRRDVEIALEPMINRYHQIKPVPCGQMGGWSFDRIEDGNLYLIHECFTAHRYDLDDVFHTSLPLHRTIDLARKEASHERN